MKQIYFFILSLISFTTIFSQTTYNLGWGIQLQGTYVESIFKVEKDKAGNIYALGGFSGTTDFDSGINENWISSNGVPLDPGNSSVDSVMNVFLVKLNPDGEVIWANTYKSFLPFFPNDMVVDDSCNIYFTARFNNSFDADPGVGIDSIFSAIPWPIPNPSLTWYISGCLMKVDSSGGTVWAKVQDQYWIQDLSYHNGEIFASAVTSNDPIDADPGPGVHTLQPQWLEDIFLMKMDLDANLLWINETLGTTNSKIDVDSNGFVYLATNLQGGTTVDLDPGPGQFLVVGTGYYSRDVIISKYNNNGTFTEGYQLASRRGVFIGDIEADELGGVFLTGNFQDSTDFDYLGVGNIVIPSTVYQNWAEDVFIAHYSNGLLDWVNSYGDTLYDAGICLEVYNGSEVLLGGNFAGTVNFDNTTLSSNGFSDIFVQELDYNGNVTDTKVIGGIAGDVIYDMFLDENRNLYISGDFSYTVDLSLGGVPFLFTALDQTDGFLIKYEMPYLSLTESGFEQTFKLYPNPSNGQFNLKFEEQVDKIQIDIFSVQGQLIHSENHFQTNLIHSSFEAPKGIYLMKVSVDGGERTLKLIME